MKNSLRDWWKVGTAKARLLSSGANLKTGFLNTTSQFERLSKLSFDDDKMIKNCGHRLATFVKRQMDEVSPEDGPRYQRLDTLLTTMSRNPTFAQASDW
eukprot:1187875-Prorocentrum_lima.AAC.1